MHVTVVRSGPLCAIRPEPWLGSSISPRIPTRLAPTRSTRSSDPGIRFIITITTRITNTKEADDLNSESGPRKQKDRWNIRLVDSLISSPIMETIMWQCIPFYAGVPPSPITSSLVRSTPFLSFPLLSHPVSVLFPSNKASLLFHTTDDLCRGERVIALPSHLI